MTEKINALKEENQKLLSTLEAERLEHMAQQRDFHTAVVVAERGREEAQAEMTSLTAYPSLSVSNFSSDWSDGRAFCALIHNIRPNLVDRARLSQSGCTQLAIDKAAELGVSIEPSIFSSSTPDWKHVMAAVFELYKKYEFVEGSHGQ
ncbi:hypothetical protein OESDEN_13326 [Oesophagostomum dentatum]|uniref:Calponin-homology (CH) domain-containing protein n=1 Tax=Oesophagostomum dentatum TaxID=61180 RepID=A0A0B1SUL6_OESDE|nr:hypothetical protein OESDEN_13326 [Oesophagostomum dentatum]